MTERIWGDMVIGEDRDESGRLVSQTVLLQRNPMEEIVRCRDCAHYDAREGFGCSILGRWVDGTGGFASCDMGANGFCAWGDRRD